MSFLARATTPALKWRDMIMMNDWTVLEAEPEPELIQTWNLVDDAITEFALTGMSSFGVQNISYDDEDVSGNTTTPGLPVIYNCYWLDVDVVGNNRNTMYDIPTASECSDWCEVNLDCEIWTYETATRSCTSKVLGDSTGVLLVSKAGYISGRRTCKINGNYDNLDVTVTIQRNHVIIGKEIGVLYDLDLWRCAMVCHSYPRCEAFKLNTDAKCHMFATPFCTETASFGEFAGILDRCGENLTCSSSTSAFPTTLPPTTNPPTTLPPTTNPTTTAPPTTNPTTAPLTTTAPTNTPTTGPPSPNLYGLVSDYRGADFANQSIFNWETFNDPTRGYVDYIPYEEANASGLITVTGDNRVILRSDSTNIAQGRGRKSIRLSSMDRYNDGLFVWKVLHMPAGCGNWPALWTVGRNWPTNGEIDVVEGANKQKSNNIALHTGPGCSMFSSTLPFNGSWIRRFQDNNEMRDCYARATPENYGCAIKSNNMTSFGDNLNKTGGGYFVMEMNVQHIKVWYFNMSEVPQGVVSGSPDTSNWPIPLAAFAMGGECELRRNFNEHVLVINNTFCGGYAGWTFLNDGCPDVGPPTGSQLQKCEEFVRTQPQAFREAYWDLGYIRVYQIGKGVRGIPDNRKA